MSDQPADPNSPAILPLDGCVQPSHTSATPLNQNVMPAVHKIFLGPNGLRAGWRLLIFALLFATLAWSVNEGLRFAVHHHWIPRPPNPNKEFTPLALIFGECLFVLFTVVPTAIMAKIEGRPMGVYGLPARGAFGKLFWEGCLWGFGALTALLVVLRLTGNFYFGQITLHGNAIAYFGLLWGVGFLLVGIAEEYLLRGYAQYTLSTGIGFWPAVVVLSLVFGWMHTHNPGETPLGIVDVVLAGIALAVALWKTGNLWFAVGLHFAWDWAQSFLFGVPDSGTVSKGTLFTPIIPAGRPAWLTGGTVGPEGSIFSALAEVLLIVLLFWRFKESRYPKEHPETVKAA